MDAYDPFLMQVKMHQCPAIEVFLGGAAGPGKTRSMLEDAIDRARNERGIRLIYFRATMDELLKVIDDSKQIISEWEASYNDNWHRWTFKATGSFIRFDSLHKEDAVYSHKSEEYDGIYMDECGDFSGKQMRFMRTRMRSVNVDEEGVRLVANWRGASNPGGKGHMDLLRRYVNPPDYDVEWLYGWDDAQYAETGFGWFAYPPGKRGRPLPFVVWRPEEDDEMVERNAKRIRDGVEPMVPNTRCFIPGRLEDNPILYNDPSYDATLWELAGDDPKLYKALRDGDWTAFEGQVYTEFDPKNHVIMPIIPDASWPKWRSVDWGFTAPAAIYWHTYDPARDLIITYREWYVTRMNDRDLCNGILERTPDYEKPLSGVWKTVVDPRSFWQSQGQDDFLHRADVWEKHGIPVSPGNNRRDQRKQRIHQLLALRAERDWLPGWQITVNCTNLIRTLPSLTYDRKKPEDVDTTGEDHAYDSCGYGLLDHATGEREWGAGMRRSVPLRAT